METKYALPTNKRQPRAYPAAANFEIFELTQNKTASELLHHRWWGQPIFFSTPLQRRAACAGLGNSRFWWEPSGGRNAQLFWGYLAGVRTLTSGYTKDEYRDYITENPFSVYLICFSPHRNPVQVLPWHTWVSEREYRKDLRAAQHSWQRKECAKHFEKE